MATSSQRPLELWGGVECTINRVGDRFFSQLERNGHLSRLEDLDRIAALGIRTLRYPLLWEQLAPDSLGEIDWSWADERLARLRALGIRPIIGLVHHGSGPNYTSLVDPEFPVKLARFARAVAERYPWVGAFTPVNEPLTTARFSGLYGHWYPHARDEQVFVRCLLHQLRAVVLAMRAIREIIPHAQLVQTDDLGKTFATAQLQYQADFENERRWITWDLLRGELSGAHRMWHHFRWLGVPVADLEWFAANPCPPDVIGANYYVTSERFLDHNVAAHPPECHGGNGKHRYADVAAVRARQEGLSGPKALLREMWQRYHSTIAVTEVHLGCARAEQLRWLAEMWETATALREESCDVEAVTSWSLFGADSWDTLLRCENGRYEPGAFDVRSDPPRKTALAEMLSGLARGNRFQHPVLAVPGWWHRPIRFDHRLARDAEPFVQSDTRRLLIVGNNELAQGFSIAARECALAVSEINAEQLNADLLVSSKAWAVIDCRFNAAPDLSAVCLAAEIRYVCFAKNNNLIQSPDQLVIEIGELFGTGGENDFVAAVVHDVIARRRFIAAGDAEVAATYLPDLVAAVLDLVVDGASGSWQLANAPRITRAALAEMAANFARFAISGEAAERQSDADVQRGLLPSLDSAVRHYVGVVLESTSTAEQLSAS